MRWLAPAAAGLILAVACTGSSPPTTAAATTLNFWYLASGAQPDQQFHAAAKAFHTAHPDIEVKGTMINAPDAYARMLAALSGGGGPDVMQVDAGWVGAFEATGALHEFSAAEVQSLGGKDAFVPAAWNTSGAFHSGKTTAIPWFIDTKAVYYRTDILQRLGIDPAAAFTSWGALQQTLTAIHDAHTLLPLGLGKGDGSQVGDFAPWVWGAGGSFVSDDGTQAMINQPASLNGVDEYQRLAGIFSDAATIQQSDTAVASMFAAGRFAVTFSGLGLGAQLHGNYGVAPFPPGPAGHIVYAGGSNLSILKASGHETAAYEWVKWLAGQEGQTTYVAQIGMYPALVAAAGASVFASNQYFAPFKSQISAGRTFPTIPAWPRIEKALEPYLGQIWARVVGGRAPMPSDEEAALLDKAAKDMQAAIQQPS
ncbi:MAG: extracellular solute-binding protein [Chloroflexi bacterium]|nr:MAG: extracellular solute-binding protein [Chloroflexota bacterium]